MKYVLPLLLLTVVGCKTSYYAYQTSMQPSTTTDSLFYENDSMKVVFNLKPDRIAFRLDNKLNDAMQIRWDEASISVRGKSYRVAHKETGTFKINDLQPLTTIPPKSYTRDGLIPTDNINYLNLRNTGPLLYTSTMFPYCDYGKNSVKKQAELLKGATVMIYLPIYVAGKYAAKSFQVNIDDVIASSKQPTSKKTLRQ